MQQHTEFRNTDEDISEQIKVRRVQTSCDWSIRALFLEICSSIKMSGVDEKYTWDLKSILNNQNNQSSQ